MPPQDHQRNAVRELFAVNTASALCQTAQIGALPLLIGLVLTERGFGPGTIGLIAAAPWLAILVFSRLVAPLINRIGLPAAILSSALGSGLLVVLIGGTENLGTLFVLNFLVGIGLIVRWISCDTWIVLIAPKEIRGRAIGIHETLMGLGIAAGPLVLTAAGTHGLLPFLVCAILLFSSTPWLLLARGVHRCASVDRHGSHGPFRFLTLIPTALSGAFLAGFVEMSAISLLVVYCVEAGHDRMGAALLVSAFGLGGTLLQVPIGWFADRFSGRSGQLLCAGTILAGSLLIPLLLAQSWAAAVLAFFWGGAVGGMYTLAVLEAGAKVRDHHIASAMTAAAFFYTLGSAIGPSLSGALMQLAPPHGLMIATGAVSVVFLGLLLARSMRD
jgi:MFS family permease